MKKLFFSLVAAMIAATATYAQSSMLATLSHEGEISTYYGASALREAHTAADNGDVITLSSGSFNAVDITKAVTIRGAGMAVDNTAQTEPTILMGNFNINIPDDVTARLTLEGLFHNQTITCMGNFKNGTFLKCRFKEVVYSTAGSCTTNLTIIHCRFSTKLSIGSNSSASCVNCVVMDPSQHDNTSTYEFVNCVLDKGENWEQVHNSSFKNCILKTTSGSYILGSDNIAYNCVGVGSGKGSLFNNSTNNTNSTADYTNIFTSYTGTYNDDESFELTETAKTTYKGIDGTEIGIYGGNMPFSTTPTNPQITKCNVAAKSTADGKLSVDITVNGAE